MEGSGADRSESVSAAQSWPGTEGSDTERPKPASATQAWSDVAGVDTDQSKSASAPQARPEAGGWETDRPVSPPSAAEAWPGSAERGPGGPISPPPATRAWPDAESGDEGSASSTPQSLAEARPGTESGDAGQTSAPRPDVEAWPHPEERVEGQAGQPSSAAKASPAGADDAQAGQEATHAAEVGVQERDEGRTGRAPHAAEVGADGPSTGEAQAGQAPRAFEVGADGRGSDRAGQPPDTAEASVEEHGPDWATPPPDTAEVGSGRDQASGASWPSVELRSESDGLDEDGPESPPTAQARPGTDGAQLGSSAQPQAARLGSEPEDPAPDADEPTIRPQTAVERSEAVGQSPPPADSPAAPGLRPATVKDETDWSAAPSTVEGPAEADALDPDESSDATYPWTEAERREAVGLPPIPEPDDASGAGPLGDSGAVDGSGAFHGGGESAAESTGGEEGDDRTVADVSRDGVHHPAAGDEDMTPADSGDVSDGRVAAGPDDAVSGGRAGAGSAAPGFGSAAPFPAIGVPGSGPAAPVPGSVVPVPGSAGPGHSGEHPSGWGDRAIVDAGHGSGPPAPIEDPLYEPTLVDGSAQIENPQVENPQVGNVQGRDPGEDIAGTGSAVDETERDDTRPPDARPRDSHLRDSHPRDADPRAPHPGDADRRGDTTSRDSAPPDPAPPDSVPRDSVPRDSASSDSTAPDQLAGFDDDVTVMDTSGDVVNNATMLDPLDSSADQARNATYIDWIGGTLADAGPIPLVAPSPVVPGPPRTRMLDEQEPEEPDKPPPPGTRIMSGTMIGGIIDGAPMPETPVEQIAPPAPAPTMPKVAERFGIRFLSGADDATELFDDLRRKASASPPVPPPALLIVGDPHTGQRRLTRLIARTLAGAGVGDGSVRTADGAELRGDPAAAVAAILRAGGPPLLFERLDRAILDAADPGRVVAAVTRAHANSTVLIATATPGDYARLAGRYPDLARGFQVFRLPDLGGVSTRLALLHVLADERRVTINASGLDVVRGDLTRLAGHGDLVGARLVEAYLDRAVSRHTEREGAPRDRMVLQPVDFAGVAEDIEPVLRPPRDVDGFLRGLDEMIGLDEVKRTVGGLVAEARLAAERATRRLPSGNPSRHLIFLGRPGTGKATVAGLIGGIYAALNLLDSGQLVMCSARDFAGGDIAAKVAARVDRASGGVLLIEEAYLLDRMSAAVDELSRLMEERRDKFMVICASLPDEMEGFLLANPGFRAEFGAIVEFREPTDRQLVQLFSRLAERDLYMLDEELRVELLDRFGGMRSYPGFAFADTVRRLFDNIVARQASRLAGSQVNPAAFARLTVQDLPASEGARLLQELHPNRPRRSPE